jgi:hypothetical protein
MIQLIRDDTTTINTQATSIDLMTAYDYGLLTTLTSQQTGKSKTFISGVNYDNVPRFAYIIILVKPSASGENLIAGTIFLGSTDFPLGLYDVTFYQNSSGVNLDPTGLPIVGTTLCNLAASSDVQPVQYSEYTTNDSDTESVYITF